MNYVVSFLITEILDEKSSGEESGSGSGSESSEESSGKFSMCNNKPVVSYQCYINPVVNLYEFCFIFNDCILCLICGNLEIYFIYYSPMLH